MGFAFFLVTFAAIAVAKLVQLWWRNRRFFELFNKLPLVDGHLPIIGVGHRFLDIDGHKLYREMVRFSSQPGSSPRRIFAGPMCFVIVDDPDQVQKVFTSKNCMGKIFFYKKFIFERGLIVSSGALWKAHRKLIEPTFNSSALKSFLPIFNQKSRALVEVMERRATGESFNIFESWSALALDNILTTSTGVDTQVQYEEHNSYLMDCLVALKIFAAKMLTFGYQFDPLFRMTKLYALQEKHIKNGLMKMANSMIRAKEKSLAEKHEEENDSGKPQLFVDQLFKMRDSFSTEEISDEINTVILAGFETVSSTLSLLTLLVAFHPEVQDKIFEELESVFSSAEEEVNDEKLKQLTYLEYVIKEAMRFWPPVPFVARCTSGELDLGGYTIPVGCNICIPSVHIHRDKRHWGEDADEFKPERFEPENIKKVHSYAYMPFSRGFRNCIGYNYAYNSIKVVLAHFFRNYRVSTELKLREIEFEFTIVTKVVNGFMVEVHKQDFPGHRQRNA